MTSNVLQTYTPVTDFKKLKDPNGIWEVRTGGDVEGKSTYLIGIFEGDIIEILSAIHEKCCYNFFIKKLERKNTFFGFTKGPSKLSVYVDIPYEIICKSKEVKSVLFKRENVFIENEHGTKAILYFNNDAKAKETQERDNKIKKALSKLTEEEKKLLNIVDRRDNL